MEKEFLAIVITGFISGYLSGTFGVGGGILTTPAIRLVLDKSAAIAIGSPLVVNIPSAIIGAINYSRNKLVAWHLVKPLSVSGLFGVILGSYMTGFVNPKIIMLLTAALIFLISLNFLIPFKIANNRPARLPIKENKANMYAVGLIAGLFSGFLGLGGGTILVPVLHTLLGEDIKVSFGTSLVIIIVYALPGSVIHFFLGHVNLLLSLLLMIGVIPGAYLGSSLVPRLKSEWLKIAFALFLLMVAVYFAFFELKELKSF